MLQKGERHNDKRERYGKNRVYSHMSQSNSKITVKYRKKQFESRKETEKKEQLCF